ncbi:UDP-glycosyltransferase 85A8-like isoform X2 [Cryptomeria japonica]|uniref:UDP-glycosyltransferase 85A8-like isoform X2 n=1 Tax=Cryptomeria japonica TaxID=3369 RepID=UPI0027DA7464|nr:UDP-glycosyltransferase 85A8-like isoform X2 [Cryptomeria japonica]
MSCTHQLATSLALPPVVFWTFCTSAAIVFANCRMLLEKGYIPINVKEARRPENLITCLPGMIPRQTDLPTAFRVEDTADSTFQLMMYESKIQNKADYVLINAFEELEDPEAAEGLSKGYPALPIGPVSLPDFLQATKSSVIRHIHRPLMLCAKLHVEPNPEIQKG